MTRIIITLLTSILGLLVNAQSLQQKEQSIETGINIIVKVPKIANNKGAVYFSLYNSRENFYKRIPFQKQTGIINKQRTEVVFTNVTEGTYAIICYHDANDNHKMDFDGYMPVEDYGTSNNSRSMGPPQFDSAKFEVTTEELTFDIKF